jgi:hypothetical protein
MLYLKRLVTSLALMLPVVSSVAYAEESPDIIQLQLDNGFEVKIHTAEGLESSMTYVNGYPTIPLSGGRYLVVITDINDPSISNKGDGEFHPFPEEMVVAALEEISHPNMDFSVEVYILPYPRRGMLMSSTSGNEVFLSPHVLDINPAVGAYIIAHEIGHVFQTAYMPDPSHGWNRYKQLRDITDTDKYSNSSSHPYRPVEIFAEDFRVLFGGDLAAYGGAIENPELPSPLTVFGLREFIGEIGGTTVAATVPKVRASNHPNPFNPDTEIHIAVPDEVLAARSRVSVRIYDVRGALVRKLYSDVPDGDHLQVRWDGRDGRGNMVASSNYFAEIQAGRARATLKLVMIK